MTKRDAELRWLNPVDLEDVERVTNRPIFDELGRSLLDGDTGSNTEGEAALPRIRRRAPYHHPAALSAVAATILLVVGLVVGLVVFVGGSSVLARPITTPWHSGHPFAVTRKPASHKEGSWRLVDDLLSGRWEQNTAGPPPGYLDCTSTSACYVMSGHYPDPMAGAPLLSESLYVSTDLGSTWSVLPMPRGFAPTTPLACGGPSDCAAGGTYNGQPVLVTTSDGGHTFTIDPLPGGVGTLYQVSCPTSRFCGGLVATSANDNAIPIDATFLSTNDDGATFADAPIETGHSMQEIACTTKLDCTVVGTNDAVGMNDWTAGVAAVTTDGGRSWATGALPAGFGVSYLSTLSCADARHCSLTGDIAITVQNPPECATVHTVPDLHPPTATLPAPKTIPSAAVQAISNVESKLASEANLEAAKSNGGFSCVGAGSSAKTDGGDIATTTDGGRTWTPDQLPTDVPQPEFSGLTCPTETECWASGTEAVFQQIGGASDGGSSMLLGTNDAGQTWSRVTFTVPSTAPNYDGQSYLSIDSISCATAEACAAAGAAAQGSPTAPVYSLVVPSGG